MSTEKSKPNGTFVLLLADEGIPLLDLAKNSCPSWKPNADTHSAILPPNAPNQPIPPKQHGPDGVVIDEDNSQENTPHTSGSNTISIHPQNIPSMSIDLVVYIATTYAYQR